MTLKGRIYRLQCGKKYEFLNYIYLFENWECAYISLRQKISSPESAKICLRQNFSFYSIQFCIIASIVSYIVNYICAKFHAFIKKFTIDVIFRWL